MAIDFRDFYISYIGHPRYETNKLTEDDPINVVLQKYEMLILTNKGDVYGEPDFGCDLIEYLHETRLSESVIEDDIKIQIDKYIPETQGTGYELTVRIYDDPERFQEWMEIVFKIADYEVYAAID
jgi:uncharacterized Fe-S cluster-containing MiaB family protein